MTNRRQIATGFAASLLTMAGIERAMSQPFVDAGAFGLASAIGGDQTGALQMAVDAAAELRQPLYLGGGTYKVNSVTITRPVTIRSTGQTTLRLGGGEAIFVLGDCEDVVLEGLTLDGTEGSERDAALLSITDAQRITVRDCRLRSSRGTGIRAHGMQGTVSGCQLSDIADTGIFSIDGGGLDIVGNTIERCGNGGIRVWRNESGPDGSRIWGNRINDIDWVAGGNGQNGNGINVFRADGVSISDNHIVACAFSAIRLNATNNTRVAGNHCHDSGEVAIFSEFEFSGSIISNNVIEGGAAGISMTNFDHGGRLSVCQGNVVRNLAERSRTNADTVPYGIAAEADAAVTGNIVEAVPGTGISVGWGPYLRDVLVNDNLVRDCTLGIVVSVAPGAGHAHISGNVVSGSRKHAIVGAQWADVVSTDLPADSGRFPNIAIEGNSIV
jgi:uncharacterized secreted repeat protein (TIGR03808 family)